MELRTLRYLVEIAEEKSINRAAEKLYVSQPTLSRAIQAWNGSWALRCWSAPTTG